MKEVDRVLLFGISNVITFDHMALINIYISTYREATKATFIHANALVIIDLLFQMFCDNKSLQGRQIHLW